MIERTLKCDILGRRETERKPVRKVRVVVQMLCEKTAEMDVGPTDLGDDPEFCWVSHHATTKKDMCPDAITRAIKFAERAVSRPTERGASDA